MATQAVTSNRPLAPAPVSRMALDAITKGRRAGPLRVLLFGTEGIGKSTFAAGAPAPVFLCPEDGTKHLDIARFPEPETWADVLQAIRVLAEGEHTYRTFVLDTLDWIEPLIWAELCRRTGSKSIEEVGGGYGKGYVYALEEWRIMLRSLEMLKRDKSMNVVLLAHAQVKAYNNPTGSNWDRYTLKIHDTPGRSAAGLVREWCDDVLFATYEEYAVEGKGSKAKGVSSGARVVHSERTAAYDAKNRHDLPDPMPLSWDDYAAAVEAQRPADPAELKKAIEEKLERVTDQAVKAKAKDATAKAGDDAAQLAKINDRLNAILGGKEGG